MDAVLPTAACLVPAELRIVIFDFSNGGKGNFDDFTVRAFHLDAWRGECLSGFHAANDAPHALAIHRYDLNIVFAV